MLPGFRRSRFNLGSLWSGKVVTILASFLITGLSTRYFGLEKMGVWLLAVNAASYILLFDFGASSALPRILPALHVQGKKEKINSLLRTTYTLRGAWP
jgi:O-antigen/teichoic acid export membrane protein